jgi:hypothetical protein
MTLPPANASNSLPPAAQNQPDGISKRIFRQLTAPKKTPPAVPASQPAVAETVDPAQTNTTQVAVASQPRKRRGFQFMPAFWTVASLISLTVNIILIVVLVGVASQLFVLKAIVENQLIGGLAKNFAAMDQAHIITSVKIDTKVPAKFSLPLETDTSVTLTKDTTIKAAKVSLATGGLQIINAPTNIVLPAGTVLPIHLNLSVPVDQQIPVVLNVPIDIPLAQTELHKPFAGLQDVVRPYQVLLSSVPGTWREIICGPKPSDFCKAAIP